MSRRARHPVRPAACGSQWPRYLQPRHFKNEVNPMLVRVLLLAGLLIPLLATTSRAQTGSAQLKVRHIHVWVKDVASTKAFYGDKLGLQVTSERAGEVVEFEGGNLWFGKARFSDPIQTNGITIGIHADSVEAAYRAYCSSGASTLPIPPNSMASDGPSPFKTRTDTWWWSREESKGCSLPYLPTGQHSPGGMGLPCGQWAG